MQVACYVVSTAFQRVLSGSVLAVVPAVFDSRAGQFQRPANDPIGEQFFEPCAGPAFKFRQPVRERVFDAATVVTTRVDVLSFGRRLAHVRETLQKSSASGHDIIGSEVDWRIWVEVNEAADTRGRGLNVTARRRGGRCFWLRWS